MHPTVRHWHPHVVLLFLLSSKCKGSFVKMKYFQQSTVTWIIVLCGVRGLEVEVDLAIMRSRVRVPGAGLIFGIFHRPTH